MVNWGIRACVLAPSTSIIVTISTVLVFECASLKPLSNFDRPSIVRPMEAHVAFAHPEMSSSSNSRQSVPPRAHRKTKTRNGVILTSSSPSGRPSRPLASRPWLQRQCPRSFRIGLRRLDPLRLSCSYFSPRRCLLHGPLQDRCWDVTRARWCTKSVAFDMDKRIRQARVVDGCRSGCNALAGRVMRIKKTKGRKKCRWVKKG